MASLSAADAAELAANGAVVEQQTDQGVLLSIPFPTKKARAALTLEELRDGIIGDVLLHCRGVKALDRLLARYPWGKDEVLLVATWDWERIAGKNMRGDQTTWAAAFSHPRLSFEGSLSKLPQLIAAEPSVFEKLVVAEKERSLEKEAFFPSAAGAAAAAAAAGAGSIIAPSPSPSSVSSPFITILTEALMSAVVSANAAAVDICLRHGALPAAAIPFAFGQKTSALHVSCEKKEWAIMKRLVTELSKRPAEESDINVLADDGSTALHRAAERGATSMARHLVLHGANPKIVNKEGATALALCKAWYFARYEEMKEALSSARREQNWQRRKHLICHRHAYLKEVAANVAREDAYEKSREEGEEGEEEEETGGQEEAGAAEQK